MNRVLLILEPGQHRFDGGFHSNFPELHIKDLVSDLIKFIEILESLGNYHKIPCFQYIEKI